MEDAIVHAPLRSNGSPAFAWRQQLEGTYYAMRLHWNTRDTSWMLDIGSADGTWLVLSIRVEVDVDLYGAFDDARLPPGQLYCEDTRGTHFPPPRDGWRGSHRLRYRSAVLVAEHAGASTEIR